MSFGARFLAVPDLFPARRSGHRWGERDLCVDCAGGPYLFSGLSDAQIAVLETRYRELRSPDADTEQAVEILVFRVDETDFRPLDAIPGRPYAMDLDFREETVGVAAEKLMGLVRLSPLRAALWTSVEGPESDLVRVVENFFRLLVAYRLSQLGGVLLHSAAAIRGSRAYLFLGRSGAGKTTISRINRDAGFEVLSDDMNAVLPSSRGAVVEQLPFAGDLGQGSGSRRSGFLTSLLRLEKAAAHELRPLPHPEAVALLVSCAPYLNGDPHRTDKLIENVERLLASLTPQVLAFRPDSGFWDLLKEDA